MKKVIALFCTALLSMSVYATSGNGDGNGRATAMGPRVTCELPNGSVEYIPSEYCKAYKGKILYWN